MIICNSVSKFILKEVDLHIPKGTVVGLIGSSGSGKTTFLRLAAGLLQPDSGEIFTCRYNPIEDRKKLLGDIALLLTNSQVFKNEYSIEAGLEEIRSIYGINKKDFKSRLDEISRILDFESFIAEKPRSLSLGQKRRAELGSVFCRDAKVYLLDEPCMGLDQNGKAAFYELVRRRKDEGATFVISSHDAEGILSVADRIIVLEQGRVAFYGATDELYRRLAPVNECSVEFTGKTPDISDLETEEYRIDNGRMVIRYNSNHVTGREMFENIISSTTVKSINVKKSDLAVSIKNLIEEEKK